MATLVDVDALWHVALYSALAAVGLVTCYGTAVLALNRAGRAESGARIGWLATVGVAALACAGLLAVGIWAMTQK